MTQFLAEVRKAIAAAGAAGGAALLTGISDGSLSQADWAWIVGSTLVAGFLVFLIPNKPSTPTPPTVAP